MYEFLEALKSWFPRGAGLRLLPLRLFRITHQELNFGTVQVSLHCFPGPCRLLEAATHAPWSSSPPPSEELSIDGTIFKTSPARDLYGSAETCFPRDTPFLPKRKRDSLALRHSSLWICLFDQAFMIVIFCSAQDTERARSNPYRRCQAGEERCESATASHLRTIARTSGSRGPPGDPCGCFISASMGGGRGSAPCPKPMKWQKCFV